MAHSLTSDTFTNVTSVYDDGTDLTAHKVNPTLTNQNDASYTPDNARNGKYLTRQFNCAMNQKVQIEKIIQHAKLPAFETEVNNSGQNVNIQCNSAVYAKVVNPALQTLSASYTITIDSIHCIFVDLAKPTS